MDPVSILTIVGSASKAATSLTTTLFAFVDATRNIDLSVQALYDEAKSITGSLAAINGALVNTSRDARMHEAGTTELWDSVKEPIRQCQATIDELNRSLSSIRNQGPNAVAQAYRTL